MLGESGVHTAAALGRGLADGARVEKKKTKKTDETRAARIAIVIMNNK